LIFKEWIEYFLSSIRDEEKLYLYLGLSVCNISDYNTTELHENEPCVPSLTFNRQLCIHEIRWIVLSRLALPCLRHFVLFPAPFPSTKTCKGRTDTPSQSWLTTQKSNFCHGNFWVRICCVFRVFFLNIQ
jgi:hypothetical protein